MSATREFLALSTGAYLLCSETWRLEVDRLRRERHELLGELAVVVPERDGQPEFRNVADFNLSSVRSRKDRARYLADLSATYDLDWLTLIEDFCGRVLAAERAGQPAIVLRDVPKPGTEALLNFEGFTLAREHPTILFGDGGTGKSLFALWAACRLEARGIRCLYADWEFSEADHRGRLEQLAGPAMPGIRYVRCERPLTHEIERLARIVRDEGIGYVFLDSIAVGCDGPPEAAEAAGAYFRALRQLHTGTMLLAHVSKSEGADRKPFGSSFWHNLARMTWFVERAEECGDPSTLTITCHNRKANIGPLRPSVAYEFHFTDDRITVRRVDVAAVADLSDKVPLWQRMVSELRGGPMTQVALAEALGAKQDTIKRTVSRSTKLFTRVTGVDGIARIALAERRSA